MLVKWSEQETELGVIGRVGENNTRKIEIDCADTLEKLPGAEIICVMLRPGDETPYTMPLEVIGNKRMIVLTDTDLERRGTIRLELRAVEDGAVLKSAILRGTVADSIRGEGDAPGQPVRDVLDRVDDTLKAAETTRKELETALGGVQGAVEAATGAADAATEAAKAAEETDAQIQAAEQGRVAAEKQRQQATAAAVQSVTDTVTDVQNKLESGTLNGKDGKDGLDAPQIDDTTISDAAPWSSQHIVDMLCPPLTESGNPVVCYPVAGSKLGVTASWEPTQDGEGMPSPDNIRTIHGRTEVSVERCGENLWKIGDVSFTTYKEVSISTPPGAYTLSYSVETEAESATSQIGILVDGGWKYYQVNNKTRASIQISATRGITGMRFYAGSSPSHTNAATYKDIYLKVGTSAPAEYAPYTGSTTTLTSPNTIYGGTVDAVTGEGAGMWRLITVDGTEDWKLARGYCEAAYKDYGIPSSKDDISTAKLSQIVDRYTIDNPYANISADNCAWVYSSNLYPYANLRIKHPAEQSSVDNWKSYLAAQYAAGTPVQIAYKLATPIPFTATGGGTIKALSGTNTILTDTDALTVTGRADPIHIIQRLQAASTASAQALADDTMESTQDEAMTE